MNYYTGVTIGPIYKTLASAKKTRELWGASYLFSYLMRQIIEKMRDRRFVVPYTGDDTLFRGGKGVGLFHDRFIFVSDEANAKSDRVALEEAIAQILASFAQESRLGEEFVENYFQIHIVQKPFDSGENPILKMAPYLDSVELFYRVGQYDPMKLNKMLKGNNAFLTKDAFGGKKSFPSLPEIAMHDLVAKGDLDIVGKIGSDELEIFEDEAVKSVLKPYHKYYAIVQADGDNMRKVIGSLKSNDAYEVFSKKLLEFCLSSDERIRAYGGETIFAGGDDLLFFAPVASGGRTLFDLCDELCVLFDETIGDTRATLSFGVSIQYYKFPLYEALKRAGSLLFVDAKSGRKNNVAFEVTKHSGQSFKSVISRNDVALYGAFSGFAVNVENKEGMDVMLHTLHHKLESYRKLLPFVAGDRERLDAFFSNLFNKELHRGFTVQFSQAKKLIEAAYAGVAPDDEKAADEALEKVYATLRFVKFIQGDKA